MALYPDISRKEDSKKLAFGIKRAMDIFGGATALLFAAPILAAQPPQASTEQGVPVVIKQESRLVLVDAVVTDKKGIYVRDLKQNDFKVYEDNKEQSISSFSSGSDGATQANGQKRYLILFFDNSTMQAPDQIQARNAANKFIAANANADHLMAVVDFGGALRIVQNWPGCGPTTCRAASTARCNRAPTPFMAAPCRSCRTSPPTRICCAPR